jgi:membrane protein YdbS with pleckstrin-like domain
MLATVLLYLNVVAGSAAGTIYLLWAWKWERRQRRLLAFMNALLAAAAYAIAVAYALMLWEQPVNAAVTIRAVIPLLLVVPAIARWYELRADERRDAFESAAATALGEPSER